MFVEFEAMGIRMGEIDCYDHVLSLDTTENFECGTPLGLALLGVVFEFGALSRSLSLCTL